MVTMHVHLQDAPDVQSQARVRLCGWFVLREFELFADEAYADFLFGFPPGGSLRMTTRIVGFAPSGREIRTRSGRLYELGESCVNPSAWLSILEAAGRLQVSHDFQDVTAEYSKKMSDMTH